MMAGAGTLSTLAASIYGLRRAAILARLACPHPSTPYSGIPAADTECLSGSATAGTAEIHACHVAEPTVKTKRQQPGPALDALAASS